MERTLCIIFIQDFSMFTGEWDFKFTKANML